MSRDRSLPQSLLLSTDCFSADVLERQAKEHGFSQPSTLEALLWDYEIFAQLERRAGTAIRLTGGAAAQLYVAEDRQRASVDVDVLTSLPRADIEAHLAGVSQSLDIGKPYFLFEPYVPTAPAKVEGLYSHTVLVPTAIGQKWRMPDGMTIEARMIKVDFHELGSIPPGHP